MNYSINESKIYFNTFKYDSLINNSGERITEDFCDRKKTPSSLHEEPFYDISYKTHLN